MGTHFDRRKKHVTISGILFSSGRIDKETKVGINLLKIQLWLNNLVTQKDKDVAEEVEEEEEEI